MKKLSILFFLLLFTVTLFILKYSTNFQKQKSQATIIGSASSKASLLDASINNDEQRIYELLKKVTPNDETKNEIFYLVKDINWASLNDIDENASIELLDWIDKNEISSELSIINLLKATKGLDGAIAEKYSATISGLFLQDKHIFITCLSKLPADNIDIICSLVAYGCSYYDLKQIVDDTNKMLIAEKMSNQEIIAAEKLIKSLNEVQN